MCRTAGVDKLPKRPWKDAWEETWEQILGQLALHSVPAMFLALRQSRSSQNAGRLIMLAEQTGPRECPFVDS